MMYRLDVTADNLENALMWPEDYNWGPSQTQERPTQGGGTAVWDSLQNDWVFKEPPTWWEDCKPGDIVPSEWGLL
jgi:hypothetical protein